MLILTSPAPAAVGHVVAETKTSTSGGQLGAVNSGRVSMTTRSCSRYATTCSVSSTLVSSRDQNAKPMKKRAREPEDDDLRPEYPPEFFKNMNPNRFAGVKKIYKRTFVMLDEDVSVVFQSSEAVNTVLRSAIEAMRTAAPKRDTAKRPQKRKAS